jgi:acyl-CoA thioester hydrolase
VGRPPYRQAFDVRYVEVDQQGVVFNMWYLAWFDEAMAGFLRHGGLPYPALLATGHDVQLVHTEVDWVGAVRYGERAEVEVSLARVGRTSFALDFAVTAGDRVTATATTVYVVIATDGSGKRAVPGFVLDALGEVRPLRQ